MLEKSIWQVWPAEDMSTSNITQDTRCTHGVIFLMLSLCHSHKTSNFFMRKISGEDGQCLGSRNTRRHSI
jgi:hypothetical protein